MVGMSCVECLAMAMLVLRDPSGIRPAYYYVDDEIIVATSERPVIQTAFNVAADSIKEIKRGHALVVKKDGTYDMVSVKPIRTQGVLSSASIFLEETMKTFTGTNELGKTPMSYYTKTINNDLKNTVFSFIPNTAEVSLWYDEGH